MTEQEFRNKYVSKAVHCDTEEKAKELLALAHSFGWKGFNGNVLIENKDWPFIKEYNCYLFGLDKTTLRSSYKFYKSKGYEIVKFESEEKKVKKTKKVFDLGLYVDWTFEIDKSRDSILESVENWALECHGLTKKEMSKKGWATRDIWLKEVEADVELTEHEVKVLKALRVLGFSWIARDEDDELYAYISKPTKKSFSHSSLDSSFYLNKDLLKCVTWQDEEAINIEELLKNV